MRLLCIDPGTEKSGVVLIDTQTMDVLQSFGAAENSNLLSALEGHSADHMVVEWISSYGMPVGKETFETCLWVGRFIERFSPKPYTLIYRRDVKLNLCGTTRAKDPHVTQALLDRYPRTGGGKKPQVGVKAKPGPLFGVSSHAMAALAVGHTWVDMQRQNGRIAA